MPRDVHTIDLTPTAFESVTVPDSATALTAATRKAKKAVFITVETAQVRYRMDGSDPTSSVGHLLNKSGSLYISNQTAIENIRFIRTGTVSGVLRVTYYGAIT